MKTIQFFSAAKQLGSAILCLIAHIAQLYYRFVLIFSRIAIVLCMGCSVWIGILNIRTGKYVFVIIGCVALLLGSLLILSSRHALKAAQPGELLYTGVFSVIRHPMYTGWILLNLACCFASCHLAIIIPCVIQCILFLAIMHEEDLQNVKRYGVKYRYYSTLVPGICLLTGMIKCIFRLLLPIPEDK